MKLNLLSSTLIASSFMLTLTAHAQNNGHQQYTYAPPANHYQAPKPMTEGVLKQRLDAQITITKRQMAFDKKQAEDYAMNFSRYQQQQANALLGMMDQAEKQRQFTIKRLEMQQQQILNQFSKYLQS